MRYAVIDIGSNSVRYLGRGEKSLITTRLAAGLDTTRRLSEESMDKTISALCEFRRRAREEGLTPCCYATSAVRDAENRSDFLVRAARECGLRIDVLPGEKEAEYARLGAAGDGALLDIGGGSTQLIGAGYALSFPMGCVRAKDAVAACKDLPAMREQLANACRGLFRFPRILEHSYTGVGGTVTTLAALRLGLARYDSAAVSAVQLSRSDVEELILSLYAMGDGRKNHPLLTDRHDVILPGALVLSFVMQNAFIESLAVSDADGMEGYRAMLTARDAEIVGATT